MPFFIVIFQSGHMRTSPKQIIELLKNRISEFENDEKLVEKNRKKNKYSC